MKEQGKTLMGFHIDSEVADLVRAVAKVQGISYQDLANTALIEYFQRHRREIQKQTNTIDKRISKLPKNRQSS